MTTPNDSDAERELQRVEEIERKKMQDAARERFLASLKWHEGTAPKDRFGKFDEARPLVCISSVDGKAFFVGDSNWLGGVCDDCVGYRPCDVSRWAYLWEEGQ